MCQQAYRLFRECVNNEFPHSFYYIGEMAERGDLDGEKNMELAIECYTIASSYNSPYAYFKLAQLYCIVHKIDQSQGKLK